MVGIVIVAHAGLAEELLNVARIVTGSQLDNCKAVSINIDDNPERAQERLLQAVKSVESGDGVVILVDMFGGTPSNLSLSLLTKGKIEIVTGANLPMIIEAADSGKKASLNELVRALALSARSQIRSAGEILDADTMEKGDR